MATETLNGNTETIPLSRRWDFPNRATEDQGHAGTQAISRAVTVLRLIARFGGGGAKLAELTRMTGMSHPTLHRILKCLVAERLVVQDAASRRYQLGPLNVELGLASLHKTEFQNWFHPHLENLSKITGDTAYLLVRSGADFVCLDRIEGNYPGRSLMLHIGGRRPLYFGAGGVALLAQLSDDDVEAVLQLSARDISGHPGITVEGLRRAVARARARGYGVAKDNAHLGKASIAMAITGHETPAQYAVSLAMASSRFDLAYERQASQYLRTELQLAASLPR